MIFIELKIIHLFMNLNVAFLLFAVRTQKSATENFIPSLLGHGQNLTCNSRAGSTLRVII
jgi:hypothetical protein